MLQLSPWKVPVKYGYGEAVQQAGTIVAPLLAGFTITLIGLLLSERMSARYPDAALCVLVGAVVFLLAAVQCGYAARQFTVRPDEIASWWPGLAETAATEPFGDSVKKRYAEQRAHSALHSLWAARFRRTYHVGTLLVLLGLAVVLIPPAADASTARWMAVGFAAAGFLGEAVWITATLVVDRIRSEPPRSGLARMVRAAALKIVPSYTAEMQLAEQRVAEIAAYRSGI